MWNVAMGRGREVLAAMVQWHERFGGVLVEEPENYRKNWALKGHKEVFGEGLLTSEGSFWRGQRKMMQPSFHHRRITRYGELMAERAQAMVAKLVPGETLDVQRTMNALALDIVVRALFAVEGGDEL